MQRLTTVTLLISIPLLGCSGGATGPTAPTPAAPPSLSAGGPWPGPGGASHSRAAETPMMGSCEIRTVETSVADPPVIRMVTTGTCQYSHLGRTQIDAVQHVNPVLGTSEAEVTYTAANGDLLLATNSASFTPSGPEMLSTVGVTTITGGTGRFGNATGRMDAEGTVNTATGMAVFFYNGWISYDASNRRN